MRVLVLQARKGPIRRTSRRILLTLALPALTGLVASLSIARADSAERAMTPKAAPTRRAAIEPKVDWNLFPDPTTGRVEVYRNGVYVGAVTGDEVEDPPKPRKRPEPRSD